VADRAAATPEPEPFVLVANRGEIAVRIIRSVAALGWTSAAAHPADDAVGRHLEIADQAVTLPGAGPGAYLDVDALVHAAVDAGCGLLHPGYGFAAESPRLAERCAAEGITFVGPTAATLATLGDKVAARRLAASLGVPTARGTDGPVDDDAALAWWDTLGERPAVMVKAVAGGGGRGLRVVEHRAELRDALHRARSEAATAFGTDTVYLEALVRRARHVEVQVIGDGRGTVIALGDRDCSVQRRRQKLVEIAPAPGLDRAERQGMADAAVAMATDVGYAGLGTFEFLVDIDGGGWVFVEANPRLQVEHTVTEEVTGVDLVAAGLRIAAGATIAELDLPVGPPRGVAVEARVNAETLSADGELRPSAGTLTRFEAPTGPGVRTDTAARPGDRVDPRFDTLVAKVVGHSPTPDLAPAAARTATALGEMEVAGVAVNIGLLRAVLTHPDFLAGGVDTTWLDRHLSELIPPAEVGTVDQNVVVAPVAGTVLSIAVVVGEEVGNDHPLAILESMKMEHPVAAGRSGVVGEVLVRVGDVVDAGDPIAFVDDAGGDGAAVGASEDDVDLDEVRPELAELLARRHLTSDEGRPDVVHRRHADGRRTARENVADLVDPGTFVEYGSLVIAGQTRRRDLDDLIRRTPADGLVGGLGRIDGNQAVVVSYDYTVLAGTQGQRNHRKKDRLFELAARLRLPVVLFAEGGGGRPGDTDADSISGLDTHAFAIFAGLSGLVPLVGIVSGRCFAGNAALLGCCDVVIATPDANIGMGGPAMIEGGGLGVFSPDAVGPVDVQVPNGVIDVLAPDEPAAVAEARRYLSFFTGRAPAAGEAADQRRARTVVPPNRSRVYDIRRAVEVLTDTGSGLELRPRFGVGVVTALARIEGRPLGILANNPRHLGGAIDRDAADKAARFLQLCDAHDLPVVSLIDTPGFMVGPEAEKDAQVRHFSRMFVAGAALSVPLVAVILRKGYGLGAMAMAGGSFHVPVATLAWPTGELGGMGLEGAVRLAFSKELAAIADANERQEAFEAMVARAYEHGKVLHAATAFEVDEVIDPAETRRRVAQLLDATPAPPARDGAKRAFIDTW
jgi:acetyl/propionyl-CoA carboxylase alpha subunit